MFENLQVFENRYEELNLKLYDPQSAADRELYAALMKEHKEITPIVEAYRAYQGCVESLAEAKELLEETSEKNYGSWLRKKFVKTRNCLPGWKNS